MDPAIEVAEGDPQVISTMGHPNAAKQSTSNLSRWYTPGTDYG